MSTEVAILETKEVAITGDQKDLIKKTICKDATDAEMQLFFFDCQRRGVHPLDKLIHFTKRAGKYTPITSIDFFRQRAHASGVYAGEEVPTYELLNSGAPDACTYTVYRIVQGVRCPWTAKARWDEYYPGEQLGFMWKKMPFLMLAKCAEALALRKAFPAELQGLYVREEMEQAGTERKPLLKGAEMLARMEAKDTVQGEGADGVVQVGPRTTSPQQGSDAPAPKETLFETASAVADYEAVIADGTSPEDLQKTWDEIVKDKRIATVDRTSLYQQYQRKSKTFTKGK